MIGRELDDRIERWLMDREPTIVPGTLRDAAARVPREVRVPPLVSIGDAIARRRLGRRERVVTLVAVVLTILIAMAMAILLVGGRRPSSPVTQAENGLIVFVGGPREGRASPDQHLYVVEPDGTGLRDLTGHLSGFASVPRWSPDGRRIAFVRRLVQDGPSGQVVVLDPASGGEPPLVSIAQTPRGQVGIFDLDWSPDGRSILATVVGDAGDRLLLLDTSSGATQDLGLLHFDQRARWSPDGGSLLIERDDLFVIPASQISEGVIDGPESVPGTRKIDFEERIPMHASWSFDGSAVALFTTPAEWSPQVEIVNIDTGARRVLAAKGYSPAWAPDGYLVAYLQERGLAHGAEVWVRPADGSGKPIMVGLSFVPPSWSPDGQLIMLVDRNGLFAVDADGRGRIALSPPEFRPSAADIDWLTNIELFGGAYGCCGDFGADWQAVRP